MPLHTVLYHHIKFAHNNVYRILMKIRRGPNHSISALFVQNRVNNLESIIRVAVNSLMGRVLTSANTLVMALRESSARAHSALWHRWGIVLRRDARQELLDFQPLE